MKKIIFLLLLTNICIAQTAKFSGSIFNSNKEIIANATISLTSQIDSLKIYKTISNEFGVFEMLNNPTEKSLSNSRASNSTLLNGVY